MFFLLVFGLASLGLAAFLIGEVATLARAPARGQLRRASSYGRPRQSLRPGPGELRERAVEPMKMGMAPRRPEAQPRMTVDKVSRRPDGRRRRPRDLPDDLPRQQGFFGIGGFVEECSSAA